MPWFSILPDSISFIETWAIRFFVFLGIVVIGPWALLLVYDAVLYLFRTITYDIPYIGGRARHRPRPRAPSLNERPSGRARTFSLAVQGVPSSTDQADEKLDGVKKRSKGNGYGYERSGSNVLIDD